MTKESLKKVRKRLQDCLAEKHVETDTCLKKCFNEVIKDLDREIKKKEDQHDIYAVLKLIEKILNKLPWIVSLLEKLK